MRHPEKYKEMLEKKKQKYASDPAIRQYHKERTMDYHCKKLLREFGVPKELCLTAIWVRREAYNLTPEAINELYYEAVQEEGLRFANLVFAPVLKKLKREGKWVNGLEQKV